MSTPRGVAIGEYVLTDPVATRWLHVRWQVGMTSAADRFSIRSPFVLTHQDGEGP